MSVSERKFRDPADLAARLEQDIRQRGLCPGDRYLTAAEAAEMLGTSTATVHRAMQTLARRRILVRRRNRGTFVGPQFEVKHVGAIQTVYVVMPSPGLDQNTIPMESFVYGLRARFNRANVQISFLPRGDAQAAVQQLLQSATAAGKVVGVIPISCHRNVYRRLADYGAPTVILGTPYVDQGDIASVDVDNREAGRLLTEHLIGCGHRRMAVLATTDGRPGDACFFDGVSAALTTAELPHNALVVRHVPLELVAVAAQLRELSAMPDRPTALIARTPQMARAASAAFDRLKVAAVDRCEIVYQHHPAAEESELPFTCARPRLSFADMVGKVGEMLEQLGNGEKFDNPRVIVPVDLYQKSKS